MKNLVHLVSVLHLSEEHLARLRSVSPRLVVSQRSLPPKQVYQTSAEAFAEVLSPEIEILYTSSASFPLNLVPNLRWVQTQRAGIDRFYDTPLWHSEIAITSANGVHPVQISEYVLSVMLAHGHHLPATMRLQQQAQWATDSVRASLVASELRGKTLGILGYGAIGREVARLASAFGMRVLATRRKDGTTTFDGWTPAGTGDVTGSIPERFYELSELSAMLPACDVLLLALPLIEQTRHIISTRELAYLPPHALIVNIGRGPLIDHQALVEALQAGKLGGAALDVTEPEPLPAESPLWKMENVILTPHISGMSVYYDDRLVDLFCENLRRYLDQKPLLNLVQRESGY